MQRTILSVLAVSILWLSIPAVSGGADVNGGGATNSKPPMVSGPEIWKDPAQPAAARKGARTGMVVEHPKYGTGTVVRREGDGDDAKITVNFPRYGLKKLIEKYAGLKRN